MRISTSQIFDAGSIAIQRNQANLYKTQNQLSTGRRVLSPSDDPVAASQALVVTQAQAVNQQYADNQGAAESTLALEESRMQSLTQLTQYIRERAIEAGNGAFSDADRRSVASDLKEQLKEMIGIANSTDANNHYLFSGYMSTTQPFSLDSSGTVTYAGDAGQQLLQVGSSRQIAISDPGVDVFMRIRSGNGTFATGAGASNTGSGIIDTGSVLDPAAWTGDAYSLAFTVDNTTTPAKTTYQVTDTTTGNPLLYTDPVTGVPSVDFPYVAGTAITAIPGVSFSISGTPATGDTFAVTPSTSQSIFQTLQNLITALDTGVGSDKAKQAQLQNSLNSAIVNLDQAEENVVRVEATIGSRRKELESLSSQSSDLNINYSQQLSNLQDLDYVAAITKFTQQQTQLEAAQQSFAKISGLSLFNYL